MRTERQIQDTMDFGHVTVRDLDPALFQQLRATGAGLDERMNTTVLRALGDAGAVHAGRGHAYGFTGWTTGGPAPVSHRISDAHTNS